MNPLNPSYLGPGYVAPEKRSANRKVFPFASNLAPSIEAYEDLEQGIEDHADLRTQLVFMAFMALYGKARRSSGAPSQVKFESARAYLQIGQGTRQEHGAHSFPMAGNKDNTMQLKRLELISEGMTPTKQDLFVLGFGMSDEDIELLTKHHDDEALVKEIIDSYCPGEALLEGTALNLQLNAVNRLPRSVNLQVDKPFEDYIRPKMAKWARKVIMGELTPKEAALKVIKNARAHFQKKISELEQKIQVAKAKEKIRLEGLMWMHECQLTGTREIAWQHFEKDFLNLDGSISVKKTYPLLRRLIVPKEEIKAVAKKLDFKEL